MLRRVTFSAASRRASSALVLSSSASKMMTSHASSMHEPNRQFFNCPCLTGAATDVSGHFVQLIYPSTYTSIAALMYTPIGTLALILLAYNVGVVGAKHCWYTLELTAKDYVQDQQLVAIIRYILLITILLSVENLFIEC